MATLKELRDVRLDKLRELRKLGVNPYPATVTRDTQIGQIHEKYDELEGHNVVVAGRILSIRQHGQLRFMDIKDSSGKIQLYIASDRLKSAKHANSELNFDEFSLLDAGDFVEAVGEVMKTKAGQTSVAVSRVRILAKTLRPMPSQWDGLKDKETRIRRRYLDTNMNQDVFERYIRRSKFWQATRDFLIREGFIEINVPVLEHSTGGADAKPFKTHMDALNQDFYLRISHELPLKRLIGGGYDRVFDIGPRFRNENYSDEHLPEHVAFESYAAYQDYIQGMELYERMMKEVAQATWGKLQFTIGEFEVNLDQKWPVVKYADIMRERFDVDVFNPDLDQLKQILAKHKVKLEGTVNVFRAMDSVWKLIRRDSAGPFWLIHEPIAISPLAKQDPEDSRVSQRFHPVIAGTEMGNGYSELNDPLDQLERFLEQEALREAGDDEAQMLDIDFVEMLEYGMPPACGWSYSERYFWMLEGVSAREGVPFPQLRHEVDEVTKGIYPELDFSKTVSSGHRNVVEPSTNLPKEGEYQLAVILNQDIENGRLLNAASHAVSGFVGTIVDPRQLNYLEYRDKTGEFEAVISHHPTIILRANGGKELLKAYRKAHKLRLATNAFIETMTLGPSLEEIKIVKGIGIDELDFWGVIVFGMSDEVKQVTKDFQLLK